MVGGHRILLHGLGQVRGGGEEAQEDRKTQEAKFEKQKDRKGGKKTPYFQPAKGYTGSGDNIRYCSEKARAFPFIQTSSGDLEKVEEKTEEGMVDNATSATRLGTSREIAVPRKGKV